jgi:hypothetical protein
MPQSVRESARVKSLEDTRRERSRRTQTPARKGDALRDGAATSAASPAAAPRTLPDLANAIRETNRQSCTVRAN